MSIPWAIALTFLIGGFAEEAGADLPVVTVIEDDTVITESCRVVVTPGTVIVDDEGDGVIQVRGSGITIEFMEGSVLRGAPPDARPDSYRGIGVRIVGCRAVHVQGLKVSGYWCGIWATDCEGLILQGCDGSDNRRAHLGSTAAAEDAADWLSPHHNDDNEWLTRYGSAFYVEDSEGVIVRECRVRQGQNALCLDRVINAAVFDNDFSFLSGWGVALWRSSQNVLSRNALDFCVRGYSHGVYNRGQDSAGILAFEQCNENLIIENSATHGGDGFFGFAGVEALGDKGKHDAEWYRRRGNNDNFLIGNDFSYAAAHGIEMTFSFGNRFLDNRLVENAICGVWGGYSQNTLIARNTIEGNGEMAYGLERGGINIEHGRANRIVRNVFQRNKCGVHLWWDPDEGFAGKPWALANGVDCSDNIIDANVFRGDELAYHLRGPGATVIGRNVLKDVGKELELEGPRTVIERSREWTTGGRKPAAGKTRPVARRSHLRGRQNIIMTEWGPWDHESLLVRLVEKAPPSHVYEVRGLTANGTVTLDPSKSDSSAVSLQKLAPNRYAIIAEPGAVRRYALTVTGEAGERTTHVGFIAASEWQATFFPWTESTDPRNNLAGWRELAAKEKAITLQGVSLQYAMGGLKDLPEFAGLAQQVREGLEVGSDHFGMIARTRMQLTRGLWSFKTLSDDGVRVTVDGEPVVENWTWHGPTRNDGKIEIDTEKTVEIVVEHFEIDGYAVMELDIEKSTSDH